MNTDIDFKKNDLVEDYSGTFYVVLSANKSLRSLKVEEWKHVNIKIISFDEVMNCWQEKH